MFGLYQSYKALLSYSCLSVSFGIWALIAKNVVSAISVCKKILYQQKRRPLGVDDVHLE